ncbi:hypothetical protein DSO57_1033291 [Entomophthora muscae]|uniref:Uncharacterized protein n=1 Tax=Entomophthora muscae TaxID=34485 RepID=A0ACC2S289_9FUNG|nr:hypothetical protein DSO57_1033291 [Entomophthora muscae]
MESNESFSPLEEILHFDDPRYDKVTVPESPVDHKHVPNNKTIELKLTDDNNFIIADDYQPINNQDDIITSQTKSHTQASAEEPVQSDSQITTPQFTNTPMETSSTHMTEIHTHHAPSLQTTQNSITKIVIQRIQHTI